MKLVATPFRDVPAGRSDSAQADLARVVPSPRSRDQVDPGLGSVPSPPVLVLFSRFRRFPANSRQFTPNPLFSKVIKYLELDFNRTFLLSLQRQRRRERPERVKNSRFMDPFVCRLLRGHLEPTLCTFTPEICSGCCFFVIFPQISEADGAGTGANRSADPFSWLPESLKSRRRSYMHVEAHSCVFGSTPGAPLCIRNHV